MGNKKKHDDKKIAKLALVTALLALVTQLINLITKIIEWLGTK